MEYLKIFSLDGKDVSKGEPKMLDDIIKAFSEVKIKDLKKYIAEFPEEEDYDKDAQQQALYWIIREFIETCAKLPAPLNVSLRNLNPSPNAPTKTQEDEEES